MRIFVRGVNGTGSISVCVDPLDGVAGKETDYTPLATFPPICVVPPVSICIKIRFLTQ